LRRAATLSAVIVSPCPSLFRRRPFRHPARSLSRSGGHPRQPDPPELWITTRWAEAARP
jgi:hypothetical protein